MKHSYLVRSLVPLLLLLLVVPVQALAAGRVLTHPGNVQRYTFEAPNGFIIDVLARPAPGGGYTASTVLRSASGEQMTLDFAAGAGRNSKNVLIDGDILVSYTMARNGRVRLVTVDDGVRSVSSRSMNRGGTGQAYDHLRDGILKRHSPEFIEAAEVALKAVDRTAMPASARHFIECTLGVIGWTASVWTLVTACTVLGIPTLGASCIIAIALHEAAAAAAILGCFPD